MIEELSRHKCSCQGGKHLPCTGKLASDSENYTPKMAKAVIDAVLTPYAESLAPRNEAVASLNARMSEIDGESLDLSYGNDPLCGEPLPEERAFSSQFNTGTDEHREKGSYSQVPPNLGLVVRTIPPSSSEFHSKRGREAIDTEIDDLRKDVTWDESTVCEWSEARKIKHNGYTPMSGLLVIMMGQKNSELVGKVPDDQCPFRARAVFQGLNIRTGDGTPPWMLYQEVGATPSNMASAHCALGVGAPKN